MAKDSIGKKFEDQEPECSMNYHFDAHHHSRKSYAYDLRKTAENLLLKISENEDCSNREFAVKIDELSNSEQAEIRSDMEDWEAYMFCKEYHRRKEAVDCDLPPVRSVVRERSDYEGEYQWSKGDSEYSRDDLNVLIQESRQRFSLSNMEIRSQDDGWKEEVSEEDEKRKQKQAFIEKALGNDAYKAGNFKKACEHYSNCLLHCRIKDAYNNRAQANMKLSNFTSAVSDLNEVIKMDPNNEKALYRRALCRHHMSMYYEALRDVETVCRIHPRNINAEKLRDTIKTDMSKLRGKAYRVRENFGSRCTFEIDISQLPAYADHGNNYLLEVDRTGCSKSCACGFCNDEDRRSRMKSNSLRIKERHRWKLLTLELLREMQIPLSAPQVSTDLEDEHGSATNTTVAPKLVNGDVKGQNAVHNPKEALKKYATRRTAAHSLSSFVSSKAAPRNLSTPDNEATQVRAESTENIASLINDISLTSKPVQNCVEKRAKRENLKTIQPSTLKKKYGSELNEEALASMIQSLCNDFSLEKEWSLMSQYLRLIAGLERFKIIVNFLDEETRNDLEKLIDSAISLRLEDAAKIKNLVFSSI